MKEPEVYSYFSKKLDDSYAKLLSGDLSFKSFLEEMLSISIKNKYSDLETFSYLWTSWLLYKEGDYIESKKLNDKGLEIARLNKLELIEARLLNNRALLISTQGERSDAISHLFKSLDIYTKYNKQNSKIDTILNIGCQFNESGDFDNGEIWFLKAKDLIAKTDSYKSDHGAIVNLVGVYLGKNDLKLALEYALQSIENAKKLNNLSFTVYCNHITCSVYKRLKNYKEALKYCTIAKKIAFDNSFKDMYYKANIREASILFELNRIDEALEILLEYKDKIKSIINISLVNKTLYKIYKKKEDYKNALKYHELSEESDLKNANQESKNHLASLEVKYQNKLKEKEKEILRLQKVEMEQKALRAQLNPHFFFNSLNSINKFIIDNDAENASNFLFKFSSLMRKTLENSEESFITIEEEVEYLNDYLTIEQLRLNFSFQFDIKVDEEIEDDFIKIPTMMLQPYIENCIKHGVNGIENGLIKVEFLLQKDDSILCIVEDNGSGRGESKSKHKSMGTSILENRIENLKEQFQLDFSINYIDLKSKEISTSGTRVELIIPNLDFI